MINVVQAKQDKILRWAVQAILLQNWELVEDGTLTEDELHDALSARRSMLSRLPTNVVSARLLAEFPQKLMGRA